MSAEYVSVPGIRVSSADPKLQKQARALRQQGLNLRQVAAYLGTSMETARQSLLKADNDVACNRTAEPLPVGHPLVLKAMWRGLEHWRTNSDSKG